jgi:hypothetical protein
MAISEHCPACGEKVQVPEELVGGSVQCPACQQRFDSKAPARPPEAADAISAAVPAAQRLEPCPGCGALIAYDANRCGYCGAELEYEDDERPWEDPGTAVRRDCEPHRGGLILTMGIASVVGPSLGVLLFCCPYVAPFFAVAGLGLGITAWVMGRRDLKKIDSKVMDPGGRSQTQAGWICGIIGTILSGLALLALIALASFLGVIFYTMSGKPATATPVPAVAGPAPATTARTGQGPSPSSARSPMLKKGIRGARRSLRIQRRAEVTLAQVGQDDDNQLTGSIRAPGHLQGSPHGRARADAAQNPLLTGQAP